ncbi:MAG: hypothetical protein V8Q30_12530 [Acutalibacteraceae bacterium]
MRLDFPGFCIEAQSLGSQNFPLSSDRFYYTVQDFLDIIAENFFPERAGAGNALCNLTLSPGLPAFSPAACADRQKRRYFPDFFVRYPTFFVCPVVESRVRAWKASSAALFSENREVFCSMTASVSIESGRAPGGAE